MKPIVRFGALVTPLLCGLMSCSSVPAPPAPSAADTSGSDTPAADTSGADTLAGTGGGTEATCDDPPDLGFDVAAAAGAPVLIDDLTLRAFGLEGAQGLAQDLTPTDWFCSFDVSPSVQAVIDQAESLTAAGQTTAARTLLATLLVDLGAGRGAPKLINAKLPGADETRQRVRDLHAAAAADQHAGGSGEDFISDAADVFEKWVNGDKDPLADATLEEALEIEAEAQLLGLDGVDSDAGDRVREVAAGSLNESLLAFNECTASKEEVKALLESWATALLVGAAPEGAGDSVVQAVAQASLRLGSNPDVVDQLLGGPFFEPVCSATFTFSRGVSLGLTLSGEGSVCDGGIWQGTVTLSGNPSSSGEFAFTIFAGDDGAETTIPTIGTFVLADSTVSFQDPLLMRFFVDTETRTADITIVSTGAGTAFTQVGVIEFASVFTPEPEFTVDLAPNPNCPTP